MAMSFKEKRDIRAELLEIITDIKNHKFAPVYLICGDEPYYGDLITDALSEYVLQLQEKDFNFITLYGSDVNGGQIDNLAKKYPMFAEHQLIIVKEAQNISKPEQLEPYLSNPLPETVLALFYSSGTPDKRTSFYKTLKKNALVFESEPLKETEVEGWVKRYLQKRNIGIEPEALTLFSTNVSLSLRTIVLELEKLIKALSDKTSTITTSLVEENIGVSREYNIFQLNRAIIERNSAKALKIATYLGNNSRKFPIQANLGGMFYEFYNLEKYYVYTKMGGSSTGAKFPYSPSYYQIGIRNYSGRALMRIIALLNEYDFKSKSSDSGVATDGELLIELVIKILSL